METVLKLVTEIHQDVRELDRKLTTHMETHSVEAERYVEELRRAAFVDGDVDRHRQMQQIALAKAEENNRLKHEFGNAIVRWGVAGALGFLVYALWKALLEGPK